MIHPSFQEKIKDVVILLAKHQVRDACVFGSAVTGHFDKDSDVDLLINFKEGLDPVVAGDLWWSLHDGLRELFNREIDLVTERSLKNPYFIDEVNRTKQLIYG